MQAGVEWSFTGDGAVHVCVCTCRGGVCVQVGDGDVHEVCMHVGVVFVCRLGKRLCVCGCVCVCAHAFHAGSSHPRCMERLHSMETAGFHTCFLSSSLQGTYSYLHFTMSQQSRWPELNQVAQPEGKRAQIQPHAYLMPK